MYHNKIKGKLGFNFAFVARIHGGLLMVESAFFLLCIAVAIYYQEDTLKYFIIALATSFSIGLVGLYLGRNASTLIGKREGSIVVTFTWIIFSLIGLIPFWLSGAIPSFTDAFFETISGFTTTGSSILSNIEVLPKSLLFWRSLTQWIGGLGIIAITMAILPIFGFNGSQIYSAEITGISKEKIHPKVSGTAKRLLGIYLFITLAGILGLYLAGMTFYDAVNHTFTAVSTGGFSTKNASIAHWNSASIEWIIIVLMLGSSVNLSLYYFLVTGKFSKFFKDEELRTFLIIIAITATIIILYRIPFGEDLGYNIRSSIFTVSTLLTSTGFGLVDYSVWSPLLYVFILIMIIGGSAGSTAGGLKTIRILLIFKYSYYEFKRIIHPHAVFPVRYNGKPIKDETVTKLLAFLILYVIMLFIGSAILSLAGLEFDESIAGMISCLSNVGPGLGSIGPVGNYSELSVFVKWFMSFSMLVGRLEIFTVLLILTPAFWKK